MKKGRNHWIALTGILVTLSGCAPEIPAAMDQATTGSSAVSRSARRTQVRLRHQSYLDAAWNALEDDAWSPGTPMDRAVAWSELEPSRAPVLTEEQLKSVFRTLRDPRFLRVSEGEFPRRPSWLFPDDGCYSRAGLLSRRARAFGFPAPIKVFTFGNLSARTPNSAEGEVYWWFHVGVAYRAWDGGNESLRILDPTLGPEGPLSLAEWISRQSTEPSSVTAAFCDSRAYHPDGSCLEPEPDADEAAAEDESTFLDQEWSRQEELGRDPALWLGDHPPWF